MKLLLVCLCLGFFEPALNAQYIVDLPRVSYFLGSTFSIFSYEGQFYAVQHINAPVITLSNDLRVAQRSQGILVVYDQISLETHTYQFDPPTNNNEHQVQGIIAFHGDEYNQMLLTTGPDGLIRTLNTGYLSSLDFRDGIQAIHCFCVPEHQTDYPCASGGEGAGECKVNFHPKNRDNGCWTACAQGFHACCNLH